MWRGAGRRARGMGWLLAIAAAAAPPPAGGADGAPGVRPGVSLTPHAPILIASDADFTAAKGVTGGAGTPGDPFVISGWVIEVGGGKGIDVRKTTKPFVIRDVLVKGSERKGVGVVVEGAANATVEHVTATDLLLGIDTNEVASLVLRANRADRNLFGVRDRRSPDVAILGNAGEGNASRCISRAQASDRETHPRVEDNVCLGGSGAALELAGLGLEATGNIAEGVNGRGFWLLGFTHAHGNIARRNKTGFYAMAAFSRIENNLAEANVNDGIDITNCYGCIIRGNTIRGNGSAGILAFAIQGAVPRGQNRIVGNHVGFNPFGIALVHGANSNVVEGTEWTDGQQSFLRGEDLNTIVDAGSDRTGAAGEPVRFFDYVATVTVTGHAEETGDTLRDTVSIFVGPTVAAVPLEVRWDFGDGETLVLLADPLQGHALPPVVSHVYATPGVYKARLSVRALNNLGREFTLSDTTSVVIEGA